MPKSYADIYLLPLPKKNLRKYQSVATKFGLMAREYGAVRYREFMADDLFPKGVLSFKKAAKPKRGEVVIAAVVDFTSRAHRDKVMQKMFNDPRMKKMMEAQPLSDMKKMYYGGFSSIVNL